MVQFCIKKVLSSAKVLIFEDFKNKTGEGLALSQEDIHGISEKIEKTEDWLKEEMAKQDELAPHDEPSLKTADIQLKGILI